MIICSIHLLCIFIIYIYIYTHIWLIRPLASFANSVRLKLWKQGNCDTSPCWNGLQAYLVPEHLHDGENSHFLNIKMEDDFPWFSPYILGFWGSMMFYVNVFRSVRFWNEHVFWFHHFFSQVVSFQNIRTINGTPRHILSFLPLLFVDCHATSESDCQHMGKKHQCFLHACVPRTWSA